MYYLLSEWCSLILVQFLFHFSYAFSLVTTYNYQIEGHQLFGRR